eukprot:gnl/TRDRNA2_/TRDRNA2_175499_c1_seq2.p1 gnl/TRDRNA2_/TRDRNA2_175499_c1~~gnl/TRDRNA2_/TRDRNA2_175499_c1_seq2.p1  ORF type:complete len:228 (+),score=12.86 gnl/TRDRNA2_/TRDRNA2_175499_c1_seq2:603-1286(+)
MRPIRKPRNVLHWLYSDGLHDGLNNEMVREIIQALVTMLSNGDPIGTEVWLLFHKLARNSQNHKVICEEGVVRALVMIQRRGPRSHRGLTARCILWKLHSNKQNNDVMRQAGGRWALHMHFKPWILIPHGFCFELWCISKDITAGLISCILPWIEVLHGRLKQMWHALFRCSSNSAGTEPNLQIAQLHQLHLHLVKITGCVGVLIGTLIFRSWGRSMREVEQPLLVV